MRAKPTTSLPASKPCPSKSLHVNLVEDAPVAQAATAEVAEVVEATKDRDALLLLMATEAVADAVDMVVSQVKVAEATTVALAAQTAGMAPQEALMALAASGAMARPAEVVLLRGSSRLLVDLTVAEAAEEALTSDMVGELVPTVLVATEGREALGLPLVATAEVAADGTDSTEQEVTHTIN